MTSSQYAFLRFKFHRIQIEIEDTHTEELKVNEFSPLDKPL